MRTKSLKLNGNTIEVILVCGGPGFKVYHAIGIPGYILKIGRNTVVSEEKIVARYVTLKYQPIVEQNSIIEEFDAFIKKHN